MAALTFQERQLQASALIAWEDRWSFALDMNGDGLVTASDAWLWFKWIFYAPGDWIVLMVMSNWPGSAILLKWTLATVGGWWSMGMSFAVWWMTFAILNQGRS